MRCEYVRTRVDVLMPKLLDDVFFSMCIYFFIVHFVSYEKYYIRIVPVLTTDNDH